MGDFRWLHFSDLHLNPENTSFDTLQAWDELLKCVQEQDFGERSDLYVFITGDIFNKGKFEEEEDKKIERIRKLLEILDVQKERVFWAAGNHDMKRTTGGELIHNLRKGKYDFDELRNDYKEQDENGYTPCQLLTRQRMRYYQKYNQIFFERELTKEDLDRIHQTYLLDDLNLIVLNTAITSFDNQDAGHIFIRSAELYNAFANIDESKPVFVIGHHGMSFWNHKDKQYVESLFDNKVDVFLCGHDHAPGISQFDNCKREIKQFTCGGGVFDGNCIFNFYYGSYSSSSRAIKIVPYVYKRTNQWRQDFGEISREFDENKLYYFERLINLDSKQSLTGIVSGGLAKKKEKGDETSAVWDLNCPVWRIPGDWNPDTGKQIPMDDRFRLPLSVQLIADRGKYVIFLAGDEMPGLFNALCHEEEKYSGLCKMRGELWEKRTWINYEEDKTWRNQEDGEKGILVKRKSEHLSVNELQQILMEWNEKKDRIALVFHIWSDNPCDAVICAQRAAYMLKGVFWVPVFFKTKMWDLSENEIADAEINQKIEFYNQENLAKEEEMKDLFRYRDRHLDRWHLLLKRYALQRKRDRWIWGYEAAYGVHEYVQVWLSAVNLNLFYEGGELASFLFRLSKEKTDNLTWELFLLYINSPTEIGGQLLEKLSERASESLKNLMKAWSRREPAGLLKELNYEEVARWGRQADKQDYEYAVSALEYDKIRKWVLMMSSTYGMDDIMRMLANPIYWKEAQSILNQRVEFAGDVVLKDEADYIRYLVHNQR